MALFFVGRSLLNTDRRLLKWARESDAGVSIFKRAALTKSPGVLLLLYGMSAMKAAKGFSVFHPNCKGKSRNHLCGTFAAGAHSSLVNISSMFQPAEASIVVSARIVYFASDPVKVRTEIIAVRKRKRKPKQQL